jgi:ribosomal-protein-alanine N-acetyltransferase
VITEPVAVRIAAESDAAPIAHMSRRLIERGLPWRWTPERVLRAIRDPETNAVAVGEPGTLVAFGIMSYLETDAHLLLLAVDPSRQRQGVGSAVLTWLETAARAAGARRIRVEARRDNAPARNFYCEHGYHERTIARAMYSGVLDGVRLEKWLRSEA